MASCSILKCDVVHCSAAECSRVPCSAMTRRVVHYRITASREGGAIMLSVRKAASSATCLQQLPGCRSCQVNDARPCQPLMENKEGANEGVPEHRHSKPQGSARPKCTIPWHTILAAADHLGIRLFRNGWQDFWLGSPPILHDYVVTECCTS